MSANAEPIEFVPPKFSVFRVSSWVPRIAGPTPNDQYYLLILFQYFAVSMALSIGLSSLLTAVGYNHVGIMVFLFNGVLLITFSVSYRRFIVIDSDIRTSAIWVRRFRSIALLGLHLLLFYLLLILARYPTTDMQTIVSMVGAIWVVMLIVVRSQRYAPKV